MSNIALKQFPRFYQFLNQNNINGRSQTFNIGTRKNKGKRKIEFKTKAILDSHLLFYLSQTTSALSNNLNSSVADVLNVISSASTNGSVINDKISNNVSLSLLIEQKYQYINEMLNIASVTTSTSNDGGFFGFFTNILEALLKLVESQLEAVHVPYSYGFSIIILTLLVKIATFPLSKQQVQSSLSMQKLQPKIKEIQDKYKNNPEKIQQETALLYQQAGINPLAGCLPTLATIPVFIGLYRALNKAAEEGVLREGFFWIPSLGGPTSLENRQAGLGLSWLFPFENGAPPIGWNDAIAYLILPALLVISQYVSQKILQPNKTMDESQKGVQAFLNILPFMLGWFSLNVPSGLTLYWITNNVLSTGQQIYLKRDMMDFEAKPASSSIIDTTSSTILQDKSDNVMDVSKLSGKDLNARKASFSDGKKEKRTRKGEKFRARKARETLEKNIQNTSEMKELNEEIKESNTPISSLSNNKADLSEIKVINDSKTEFDEISNSESNLEK